MVFIHKDNEITKIKKHLSIMGTHIWISNNIKDIQTKLLKRGVENLLSNAKYCNDPKFSDRHV